MKYVRTHNNVIAQHRHSKQALRGSRYPLLCFPRPREADLDRHIYNRYLRAMWALTEETGGKESAPFQYIVTTTSRPPDDIHDAICLRLEAHPPERMLFLRRLKNQEPPTTPELFPEEGESKTEDQGEGQ